MPMSWLMESSMQPSCSSSKTPSGSLLLITKESSTCLVRQLPLRTFSLSSVHVMVGSFQCFHPTEKYFDMKKTQCKEGLDIYKKFLTRMTRISEFLKVAEVRSFLHRETSCREAANARLWLWFFSFSFTQQVGIDRGDIPDLSQVRNLQAQVFFFLCS